MHHHGPKRFIQSSIRSILLRGCRLRCAAGRSMLVAGKQPRNSPAAGPALRTTRIVTTHSALREWLLWTGALASRTGGRAGVADRAGNNKRRVRSDASSMSSVDPHLPDVSSPKELTGMLLHRRIVARKGFAESQRISCLSLGMPSTGTAQPKRRVA